MGGKELLNIQHADGFLRNYNPLFQFVTCGVRFAYFHQCCGSGIWVRCLFDPGIRDG
jgi:hypothetical protein